MKIGQFYLTVILVSFLYACGGDPSTQVVDEEEAMEEMDENVAGDEQKKIVYYATPSLVEVANIMKSSGATFSNELLNDPNNSQMYNTHDKQALNLGVYGADLTYSAMFDETQSAIIYLKTVKGLSDELGMDGAFEAELLNSIEENITDREALLDVITDFYWSADSYLTDNDRLEVSSLIIAGGWIESIYIACDMANRTPDNQEIRKRIAEQKLILKNLLLFLKAGASTDEHVAVIIDDLVTLQGIYDKVEVKQGTGNTITDAEKGETIIGNETEVIMDQVQLDALSAKIGEIRQRLIE